MLGVGPPLAPDGSSLLTLDGTSVQAAPDGPGRIVWMIIGMIKDPIRNRMARRAGELPSAMGQGGRILPP